MSLKEYFPVYERLEKSDRDLLDKSVFSRSVPEGTVLHRDSSDCAGLLIVRSGQLRAFITSEEGRQVTLYRLFDRDICLFSASCMMSSIQFDITISAEKDAELLVIPAELYKSLMDRSAVISGFTNQLLATRFTDVMWLIEQIMWKSFDQRLAGFLIEECSLEETTTLKITHEQIAGHLGTAREVVTRMLRYLQDEGMVRLSRGAVELTDIERLRGLSQK